MSCRIRRSVVALTNSDPVARGQVPVQGVEARSIGRTYCVNPKGSNAEVGGGRQRWNRTCPTSSRTCSVGPGRAALAVARVVRVLARTLNRNSPCRSRTRFGGSAGVSSGGSR